MRPSTRMMPQTVSTRRKVFTVDSGGASSITHTNVLVGVRASVQPEATPEGIVAGSMQEIKSWSIFIDSGQDVKPGDVMDNPDGTGGTAEIVSVQDLSGRLAVIKFFATMQRAVNV